MHSEGKYKLGDKISVNDVRRALHWNGHVAYFDDGINITGIITSIAHFITKKICIAFKHEGRDYTVSMDEPA